MHTLRRDPRQFGLPQTRWTLDALQQVITWMRRLSFAGIHRVLDRLTIRYKRGRDYVHSPDPDYRVKLADIARCLDQARRPGNRSVTLYLDEITYYRQPSLARAYEAAGPIQPLAPRSYRSNTPTRLVGTVDPRDGRVLYRQRSEIGVSELVAFFQTVRAAHPAAERINIVVDNWPVHFHPDVLVALEAQENPWPHHRPSSWSSEPSPGARKKWGTLQLPIQLRPLPTYASWTNPIEKLWRKLRQDVLHLHRLADDLETLRSRVADFLDHYANGSPDLLRYVGILVPD